MKIKQNITKFMKGLPDGKQGFTIIELMVATVVFSLMLIILTYGVISISRTYYKGVTTNQTQNASRNIASTLTQAVEFDGVYTNLGLGSDGLTQNFCIGNQLFSYLPGYQLTGTYSPANFTTKYAFIEGNGNCSAGPISLATSGSVAGNELMGNNMRLATTVTTLLVPQGSTGLYNIDVRIAYGSNDLLCNEVQEPGSCSSSSTMTKITDFFTGKVQCKQQVGSQFCATSELQTTVARRIE